MQVKEIVNQTVAHFSKLTTMINIEKPIKMTFIDRRETIRKHQTYDKKKCTPVLIARE